MQAGVFDEPRAIQVEVQRAFGEIRQHVQFRQRRGAVLERSEVADQAFQQLFVERLLAGQGAALGR